MLRVTQRRSRLKMGLSGQKLDDAILNLLKIKLEIWRETFLWNFVVVVSNVHSRNWKPSLYVKFEFSKRLSFKPQLQDLKVCFVKQLSCAEWYFCEFVFCQFEAVIRLLFCLCMTCDIFNYFLQPYLAKTTVSHWQRRMYPFLSTSAPLTSIVLISAITHFPNMVNVMMINPIITTRTKQTRRADGVLWSAL